MGEQCEHEWRVNRAVTDLRDRRDGVCLNCRATALFSAFEARQWPYWTEEDYWDNLDAIEGDRAPEIRRLKEAMDA